MNLNIGGVGGIGGIKNDLFIKLIKPNKVINSRNNRITVNNTAQAVYGGDVGNSHIM
mgnify:CR=1 FL=1